MSIVKRLFFLALAASLLLFPGFVRRADAGGLESDYTQPNGYYVIYLQNEGLWREAGRLPYDMNLASAYRAMYTAHTTTP